MAATTSTPAQVTVATLTPAQVAVTTPTPAQLTVATTTPAQVAVATPSPALVTAPAPVLAPALTLTPSLATPGLSALPAAGDGLKGSQQDHLPGHGAGAGEGYVYDGSDDRDQFFNSCPQVHPLLEGTRGAHFVQ